MLWQQGKHLVLDEELVSDSGRATATNNDGYCRSLFMVASKYSLHAFCCGLVASLYHSNKKHVSNRATLCVIGLLATNKFFESDNLKGIDYE